MKLKDKNRGKLQIRDSYIRCVCDVGDGEETTELFKIGSCSCVNCGGADDLCKVCKGVDRIIFLIRPKKGY
jgi:hypothetical protein